MNHGKTDDSGEPAAWTLFRRCERDVLRFFNRHASTYVPTDRLAACIGYAPEDVERGHEALVAAGIVRRRSGRTPGIALYQVPAASRTGLSVRHTALRPDARPAARRGVDGRDLVAKSAAARARAAALSARSADAAARARLLAADLGARRAELRRLLSMPARPPGDDRDGSKP
jgi:hypothetical protein